MADIPIRDVRKSYGREEVVHRVSLVITFGEFIVIRGPSGCGKSTLLRMIAVLESITSGDGRSLSVDPGAARGHDGRVVLIGFRPEDVVIADPATTPLRARYDFVEELGSGKVYHLLYEDIGVAVLSPQKLDLVTGAELGLRVPLEKLHLFDAASGRRLDLHAVPTRVPELVRTTQQTSG